MGTQTNVNRAMRDAEVRDIIGRNDTSRRAVVAYWLSGVRRTTDRNRLLKITPLAKRAIVWLDNTQTACECEPTLSRNNKQCPLCHTT